MWKQQQQNKILFYLDVHEVKHVYKKGLAT